MFLHGNVNTGALPCILKPFQVIPYSPEDPPTKFTVEDSSEERLLNCYLLNVTRGQSNDAAEMQLRWLDKSYVNLTVLNRNLFFKVSYSVSSSIAASLQRTSSS